MPEVSVVVPVYNSEAYISRCIDSILAQTFTNFELILIDDSSTDKSLEICNRYAKQDHRIRIETLRTNSGAAVARNRGIDVSNGQWIAFLDADDEWMPEKLDIQLKFAKEMAADIAFTAYERVDEKGESKSIVNVKNRKKISYSRLLRNNVIGCSTALVSKAILANARFPNLRKRQDYGLWLLLARRGAKIFGQDLTLTRYHLRSDSISANRAGVIKFNWMLYREFEQITPVHAVLLIANNALRHIWRTIKSQ